MIVDTHVHPISADREHYPVQPDPPAWPTVSGETLAAEMQAAGVGQAMLVQSFFTYAFDNTYVLDCAAEWPERFQAVVVIDQLAVNAADVLEALVRKQGVRGVRFMPKGMPEGVLWDERTFPVWERAGELGVVITIAAEIEHVPNMPAVVERFPHVAVCFEHMWGVEVDGPPFAALEPVVALARFPNVNLKLAPNNSFAARDAGIPPRALFEHLIDCFGIERVMWGSNYPAHPAKFGAYGDRLAIMQEDLAYLGDAERAAFFGGNAARLWPASTAAAQ
ncbi:MAG TPA: amidohydrolase family protein [Solirubrobacteraceae bacterium]|jgi:predicted TIM-barrel fold metal-dependent hydrolase|nr:amidohydrolase family protein [Solirubrobacteraceae bacterium]